MSESVEKEVHINFTARSAVKETADEITLNVRRLAFDFQALGYGLNEINRLFLGNSAAGKELTSVIQGIGAALRIVSIMAEFQHILELIQKTSIATAIAENARAAAHTIANAAAAVGSGILGTLRGVLTALQSSSIATAVAEQARATAHAVAWAFSGPVGWAILAAAAAAAALYVATVTGLIKLQQGGIVTKPTVALIGEAGPEAVVPLPRLGGSVVNVSVDARGSTFASDYDVDKMMNRVIFRAKRAGVIER